MFEKKRFRIFVVAKINGLMKKSIFIFALLSIVLIQCKKAEEQMEIGTVKERSAEEIASIKEYAPKFNLNSIDGNQISLESMKGKYLFVDIWATWCGPCLQQIPAMKELEEKYKGQNIEFVSISVDKDADKAKWAKMIEVREMGGTQLFAGKQTSFSRDYEVSSIPKFLIIGKEGEIIDENPPRPMDYQTRKVNLELVAMLDNLLKEK